MISKQCCRCKIRRPEYMFDNSRSRPDGLNNACKKCKAINSRRRQNLGNMRDAKEKIRRGQCFCHGIKVTKKNYKKFQWDHRDWMTKKYSIGKMQKYSDASYFAEVSKCDLVCPDWHVEKTRKDNAEQWKLRTIHKCIAEEVKRIKQNQI